MLACLFKKNVCFLPLGGIVKEQGVKYYTDQTHKAEVCKYIQEQLCSLIKPGGNILIVDYVSTGITIAVVDEYLEWSLPKIPRCFFFLLSGTSNPSTFLQTTWRQRKNIHYVKNSSSEESVTTVLTNFASSSYKKRSPNPLILFASFRITDLWDGKRPTLIADNPINLKELVLNAHGAFNSEVALPIVAVSPVLKLNNRCSVRTTSSEQILKGKPQKRIIVPDVEQEQPENMLERGSAREFDERDMLLASLERRLMAIELAEARLAEERSTFALEKKQLKPDLLKKEAHSPLKEE